MGRWRKREEEEEEERKFWENKNPTQDVGNETVFHCDSCKHAAPAACINPVRRSITSVSEPTRETVTLGTL
eukprot:2581064-Pyramimonas_sp.AAC.1